jgi:hypothetical protein
MWETMTQIFGKAGLPAAAAASVWGIFVLIENCASPEFRRSVTDWLIATDVRAAVRLPHGTNELFEHIFDDRHFSLKCMVRSALFSICAMAVFLAIALLFARQEFKAQWIGLEVHEPLPGGAIFNGDQWRNLSLFLWFFSSVVLDYFILLKTRVILDKLSETSVHLVPTLLFAVLDFVVTISLYGFLLSVLEALSYCLLIPGLLNVRAFTFFLEDISKRMFPGEIIMGLNFDLPIDSVLFYAGTVPLIWIWIYLISLVLTRTIVRLQKPLDWFRWALNIKEKPFSSLGIVAAGITFVFVAVGVIVGKIHQALS